jgi:hypothetical protein
MLVRALRERAIQPAAPAASTSAAMTVAMSPR